MTRTSNFCAALVLGLSALPMTLYADPVEFEGHHYEVIAAPGISWPDADNEANMKMFAGAFGHLATITSESEDVFIESLRAEAGLSPTEAWAGGFQQLPCPMGSTPDCNWTWVNGEGGFSKSTPATYTNWLSTEPNDDGGIEEQYLGIGLGNRFGWNDERRLSNIGGYVVEYDTEITIPAGECVESEEGCALSPATMATFPPTIQLEPGAEINVRTFEFTDDLSMCGVAPREIFVPPNSPSSGMPDAVIPAYLCGSPKFLMILAETEGVVLPEGTILVENEVGDAFPNNLYECQGPLAPNPSDPDNDPLDPQNRDRMAWSTSDPAEMLENDLGGVQGFPGTVGEFTFECGSSRAKVKSASQYYVGLHLDLGPGNEISVNPDGNHYGFVALTRYKLVLLKAAVDESRVSISRFAYRFILRPLVRSALKLHDRGRFWSARRKIRIFQFFVDIINYRPIQNENYNGEHTMRASNIEFMYTDIVIPGAQ